MRKIWYFVVRLCIGQPPAAIKTTESGEATFIAIPKAICYYYSYVSHLMNSANKSTTYKYLIVVNQLSTDESNVTCAILKKSMRIECFIHLIMRAECFLFVICQNN